MTKAERTRAAVQRVNGNRDENEKNKGRVEVDQCQLTKNGADGAPLVFAVNRMVGQLFEVRLTHGQTCNVDKPTNKNMI